MTRKIPSLYRSRALFWYIGLFGLLPLLTLVFAGLAFFWQKGLMLHVAIAWLAITLAGYAVYRLWPQKLPDSYNNSYSDSHNKTSATDTENTIPDSTAPHALPLQLSQRDDWTLAEKQLWLHSVEQINTFLEKHPEWDSLPSSSLQLIADVGASYRAMQNKEPLPQWRIDLSAPDAQVSSVAAENFTSELRFTLPELLLVFSIASERYRKLVLTHLPFAESITIASVMKLYRHQETIKKGAYWLNTIRRTVRVVNPAAAVAGELKDQFTNKIFTQASSKVQADLKRMLLQELVQVAMDLYSGRLKHSEQELSAFKSDELAIDQNNMASPPAPLRIVLLGQVSSGKSSLVNALTNELRAESDILPTTDKVTVHVLTREELPSLHIIDTPGLESSTQGIEDLTKIAVSADLIVHLVKATQPGRSPDQMLQQSIRTYYDQNSLRRPPPILMVMTYIDQLSPRAHWQPPYDLNSDNPKAQTINKAMLSALEQIGKSAISTAIPTCLSPDKGTYNIDAVIAQIMLLESDATQAQYNRRRLELGEKSGSWSDRWKQFSQLGRVLGKSLIK